MLRVGPNCESCDKELPAASPSLTGATMIPASTARANTSALMQFVIAGDGISSGFHCCRPTDQTRGALAVISPASSSTTRQPAPSSGSRRRQSDQRSSMAKPQPAPDMSAAWPALARPPD
jgi:hypothetical protein